jgi:hypothetical protein
LTSAKLPRGKAPPSGETALSGSHATLKFQFTPGFDIRADTRGQRHNARQAQRQSELFKSNMGY